MLLNVGVSFSMMEEISKSDFPFVSVIIHNFKGTDRLERCLSSVIKSNYPNFEIIVVDGLTNGIDDWIQNNFPSVKILHFTEDEGIPARLNAALSLVHRDSKYIARLDEDIEVDENWLQLLVDEMEKDPRIGFAQSLMLKLRNKNEIDCMGAFIDNLGYSYFHPDQRIWKNRHNEKPVSYAIAGLMRRESLEKLSQSKEPFDADYFIHWYDIDLSWRIQLAGYKVVLIPNSRIYHERRLTSGRSRLFSRNIFLNSRNRLVTLVKNYSTLNLIKCFPFLAVFEAVEIMGLLCKRPYHSIATVKGILWVVLNFKNIWKKRLLVQKYTRKVPDSYILKNFVRVNPTQLHRDLQRHYS